MCFYRNNVKQDVLKVVETSWMNYPLVHNFWKDLFWLRLIPDYVFQLVVDLLQKDLFRPRFN